MGQLPIYTIGYGARNITDFIAVLQTNHIAFLIDVRSKPYSHYKPNFSKQSLENHLKAANIRYVFMGDTLGGMPDDPDCYDESGKVAYDKIAQKAFYHEGIGRLQNAHQQGHKVVIMCSEGKPENCHRTKLISKTLLAQNIPVIHIDEKDQLVDQEGAAVPSEPKIPDEPEWLDDFSQFEAETLLNEYESGALFDEYGASELFEDDWNPPQPSLPSAVLPTVTADLSGAQTLLKQIFGFDTFRPLQAEIIKHLLQKQDALAIMPTGSGKSLCFQLPALLFPGLTVVVSPLISLMQDQVEQLRELGVPAVFLNSSLSHSDYLWTTQQIRAGNVKLLYAAPETLLRPETLLLLEEVPVDCLTIDEAHCISEWGHDFRPEYRQLVALRQRLADAACIALTATATQRVRADIKSSLAIPQAGEFIASFNRKNLHLAVEPKTDGFAQTVAFLQAHPDQSGIIYCATRKQVDELTAHLAARSWSVLPYHGGLDNGTRARNQRSFITDDVPIIVATIAFGMGINKSNVRFILHHDLPKNIESYYQQIGRAGRDGLQADCLLLFSYADVRTINFFISQQADSQQRGARMRLDALLSFVETNECRRRPLLNYFGEEYTVENCELCDNCLSDDEDLADLTIPAQKFLSCVKRTGEMFGMVHIIDVLRGSRNKRVLQRGHDSLSTYNIGREYSKKDWQYLARQFIQQSLIIQDMEHGSLKLTAKAFAVFRGEKVFGTLPEQPRRATTTGPQVEYDRPLFELLRTKRKALADEAGVPPYVIFSDRSLADMATYFPHSRTTFTDMYGVGEAKLNSYADDFLPIIQDYCQENDLQEKHKPGLATQPIAGRRTRADEVLDLYNSGQTIPQISDTFGSKQRTVIGHLWKAVQAGKELRKGNLLSLSKLSTEDQQQVLDAFAELGTDYLRPIYEAMNATINYDELDLLRLHFASTK